MHDFVCKRVSVSVCAHEGERARDSESAGGCRAGEKEEHPPASPAHAPESTGAETQGRRRSRRGRRSSGLSEGRKEAILGAVSPKPVGRFKSLGSENPGQGLPMDCGQSPKRRGRHEGS